MDNKHKKYMDKAEEYLKECGVVEGVDMKQYYIARMAKLFEIEEKIDRISKKLNTTSPIPPCPRPVDIV